MNAKLSTRERIMYFAFGIGFAYTPIGIAAFAVWEATGSEIAKYVAYPLALVFVCGVIGFVGLAAYVAFSSIRDAIVGEIR